MSDPQKMGCRWLHRWTAWKDIMEGREKLVKDPTDDGRPIVIQERRCVKCNQAERVTVRP